MSGKTILNIFFNQNRTRVPVSPPVPESYVVIDIETTDLPKKDKNGNPDFSHIHIVEIGWCVVRQRHVVERLAVQLRLPKDVDIHPTALKTHGYTHKRLDEVGVDPTAMLAAFLMLLHIRARGLPIVGHNLAAYDIPVIETNWQRYGIIHRELFRTRPVYDTLAISRAATPPLQQEPLEHGIAFAARVREHTKSSLDHLSKKYHIDLPRGDHRADEDALITHRLFEALRADGSLAWVLGKGQSA